MEVEEPFVADLGENQLSHVSAQLDVELDDD
jgi:hypothetical protein